jgi:type I restriction enzyme S subunit
MSFPRYPEYKSQLSSITEVAPAHWKVMELRWVARLQSGESITSERILPEGEYPVFGGGGLRGYTDAFTHDGEFPLIGRQGALCGNINIGCGRFWASEHSVVVSPTDGANTRWLAEALRTMNLNQYSVSAAQPGLSVDVIRRLSIPVPPLEEQQAIASFLDRETAKIDALVAEQERLIALMKEKRQAVISHAVTKGLNPDALMKDSGVENLGRIPADWTVQRLAKLSTKITNGYVGPTREILVEDGVRYLQSLHIKANKIRFDVPYFVSQDWSDAHAKSILRAGDVLIVQTGDVGQTAVVTPDFDGCNCHALIIVSPLGAVVEGSWVSWVLNSSYGADSLASIQTGALHPHLNCGDVKDVIIPLPPLEEQRRIIFGLENELRQIDALVEESQQMTGILDQRRSALITAAVTGQIDVRGLASAEAA